MSSITCNVVIDHGELNEDIDDVRVLLVYGGFAYPLTWTDYVRRYPKNYEPYLSHARVYLKSPKNQKKFKINDWATKHLLYNDGVRLLFTQNGLADFYKMLKAKKKHSLVKLG